MEICGFEKPLHVNLCLCCKVMMGICGFGGPLHVSLYLHCQYSGLSKCAPVLQGDDGDMRRWGAVACEFVSALSVQWTEQMRTCVARCRSVSTAHMGRIGGATRWE